MLPLAKDSSQAKMEVLLWQQLSVSRDLGRYADIINHKSIRQCNMIAYACIVSRLDRSINAKVMFSIRQRKYEQWLWIWLIVFVSMFWKGNSGKIKVILYYHFVRILTKNICRRRSASNFLRLMPSGIYSLYLPSTHIFKCIWEIYDV